MYTVTQDELFREEEKLKDKVYSTFDRMSQKALEKVNEGEENVRSGRYEDQDAFIPHSQLANARQHMNEVESLIDRLYDKPYFSHVKVSYEDGDGYEDFFLSDNEYLDHTIDIGNEVVKTRHLIPFKQDSKRPVTSALFHCYQAKRGDPISYIAPIGKITFTPELICDTDVQKRKLLNVIQYYPEPEESKATVTADEMLEDRLQENRGNPALLNIISTLRMQQFEIISAETYESFVVQGCAGSGKSQCLIHRLFFLRDVLRQDGWEKVLLLTPTRLFRQYSADLMRRYQLTDIYNCSIADLYRKLLAVYDDRFKERQYIYQMTEEYLPDGYLHAVYEEENVEKIESETDKAIYNYVSAGCRALGKDVPETITAAVIEEIVDELDEEIRAFDEREEVLREDKEYQGRREEYENLLKNVETAQKKLRRYNDESERNQNKQRELNRKLNEVETFEKEKREYIEQRDKRIKDAVSELEKTAGEVDQGTDIQAPARYARQLFILKDMTEGKRFNSDEEELLILDELLESARAELKEVTGEDKPENIIKRNVKRQSEIDENIKNISEEIEELTGRIEECSAWLKSAAEKYNGQMTRITLLRSEMQQSRYFLSRIESAVFEREVWNALAPLKKEFGIQALEIEELPDGRHRESRILYKADMLFYIRIYMKLYPDAALPEYNLICIDEGQDLHRADYEILRGLYPRAAFNVFGDVAQVLHSACGITEWESQTGIKKIYPLMTNYRNNAAIVDFCNKKFKLNMDYIGDIDKYQKGVIISDLSEARDVLTDLDAVLIVKDRDAYARLCDETGIDQEDYVFLDTMSEKPSGGQKECYSIFAAKGLEFSNVFVYAGHMTENQKVVACTRAMAGLYYYE